MKAGSWIALVEAIKRYHATLVPEIVAKSESSTSCPQNPDLVIP